MGLFSSSSSKTTNNYAYTPITTDEGIGLFADNSTVGVSVTTNITDGGIVSRALDSVDLATATTGAGYSKLLDTADSVFTKANKTAQSGLDKAAASQTAGFNALIATAKDIFNQGQNLIGTTQKSVADAYSQAQTDKAGTIDNRTIIVLAAAAVVGLYLLNKKRG